MDKEPVSTGDLSNAGDDPFYRYSRQGIASGSEGSFDYEAGDSEFNLPAADSVLEPGSGEAANNLNESGEISGDAFTLSGTYEIDGSGVISNIQYSVGAGDYKQVGQAAALNFAGVGPVAYVNQAPHFYLKIPVDPGTKDALAGAVITQGSYLEGTPKLVEISGDQFVFIYIGSFTGAGRDGVVRVNQGQTEDIEYDLGLSKTLAGFYFHFADGTELDIDGATVLAEYNPDAPDNHTDWFIHIPVSGDKFDTAATITCVNGVAGSTARYIGDASAAPPVAQNYYLVPVIRNGKLYSSGGVYEEDIFCAGNKGPIVRMIKIA